MVPLPPPGCANDGAYSAPCVIGILQRECVFLFGLCLYLDKPACECSTGVDVLFVPQLQAMMDINEQASE